MMADAKSGSSRRGGSTAASTHRYLHPSGDIVRPETAASLARDRRCDLLYRNQIKFHHTYYARGHLASPTYRGEAGNNTPYFLIPTLLVGGVVFFVLPRSVFVVMAPTSAVSFYVHVVLDREYHRENSRLQRLRPVPAQAAAPFATPASGDVTTSATVHEADSAPSRESAVDPRRPRLPRRPELGIPTWSAVHRRRQRF
jgi:hypothetical protein